MRLPQLTTNQKLAALAVVLGVVALFAQPRPGPFVTLDARELALVAERQVDHVSATELAAWIVDGRADYRLLDLRPAQDYAVYHIPTAEHVALPALHDYPLLRKTRRASWPPRCELSSSRKHTQAATAVTRDASFRRATGSSIPSWASIRREWRRRPCVKRTTFGSPACARPR